MFTNFGPPVVVNMFWNMPDYILRATIFKFKLAARYHDDGDGYTASY